MKKPPTPLKVITSGGLASEEGMIGETPEPIDKTFTLDELITQLETLREEVGGSN